MKLSRSTGMFLGAVALLVAGSAVLYGSAPRARIDGADSSEKTVAAGAAAAAPILTIDVLRIEPTPSRLEVKIAATLEALRQVVIGAEVSGRVVELVVSEDDEVEVGAPLVRLDPALSDAAAQRARASLDRAESVAKLAQTLHDRQRELADKGIGSRSEFDQTLSEQVRSRAAVAEARAQLLEADTLHEKTVIRAPFAGIVSRLDLEPGAYVRTGDAVAEMVDLSEIEVNVGVDDRQILSLDRDRPVIVHADALPGETFEGRIVSLGRTPNRQTLKYNVPVRVPNPDQRLLPGMLGHVQMVLGDESLVLRVPRRAVHSEFEIDFAYVVTGVEARADGARIGRAERRRVSAKPVPFRPDLLDVEDGLEPGDRIATSNLRELRPGLIVRLADPAPTSPTDALRTPLP